MPMRHRLATTCLAGALFLGCFEPAVEERLALSFQPGGGVEVELLIEHNYPLFPADEDPRVRRLAEEQRLLLDGWSPWQRRFDALEGPAADGLSWEKREGRLRSYRRWATLDDPEGLTDFFADTLVHAFYQEGDGWAELSLYPGGGSRARPEDLRVAGEALDEWSAAVAGYLTAAADVWAYLERRPGRARATIGPLFVDLVDDSVTIPEPSAREERLATRLADAMDAALSIFESPEGDRRTFEEISRLVYDPFPARISVETAGEPMDVSGFEPGPDGALVVPGLGFWASLAALEGLWLTPGPLVAIVTHLGRDDDEPFDLDAFLGRPFAAAEPPDEAEARLALEELLTPRPVYRVVWEL